MEKLQHYTKVLEFSEIEIPKSRQKWEDISIVTQILGRWVPVEWIAKDFKKREKLDYEIKG